MPLFKPMLAGKAPDDLSKLKYPVLVSPKLDGVRATIQDGVVYSRSLKPIPNGYVQTFLGKYTDPVIHNVDGELIVGPPTEHNVYNKTVSAVMTESDDTIEDLRFYMFDWYKDLPYSERLRYTRDIEWILSLGSSINIIALEHKLVNNASELEEYEASCTSQGYEGVMIRSLDGRYKEGRSSTKEGILLKLKRFLDSEAEIIGFEQLMRNHNEAKINERGNQERSTHKDNLVADEMVGALIVRDVNTGVEFNIGTGLDEADRIDFWNNQDKYLGKLVKYKYFPVGVKDKPRHSVYLGLRDKIDL